MPSSSVSSWLTVLRIASLDERLRFCPIASTSSRNSTHGALARAVSKTSWRLRSLLPTHMSSTSTSATDTNPAPSSPASAWAMKVLPHPGGP